MRISRVLATLLVLQLSSTACERQQSGTAGVMRSGFIQNGSVNEASGLQAASLNPGAFFVHNDDGRAVVYALDEAGRDLGRFGVGDIRNRDWEDITLAPSPGGPLLVIGDIGDNGAQWKSVTLHFVPEPRPDANGRYSGTLEPLHSVELTYPDGARDCESLAYDSSSGDLLLLSKRDAPPRLYRIPLATALAEKTAELEFLGESAAFRPPTSHDLLNFGHRDGPWVAQPTGLDIRPDGRQAVVISYRSTYIFNRGDNETWATALARPPVEFEGPPSRKEEAVTYFPTGDRVLITTEGLPAPVYSLSLLNDR